VLTSATFGAQGTGIRILKSGTDFTAYVGKAVLIVGDHDYEGIRATYVTASVDPASMAAGATADVTVTVTGVKLSTNGVIAQPSSTVIVAGVLWTVWVSADNAVTIRFFNTTAAPVDITVANWRFWIAR
jgi:hypothetical protein